MLIAVMAVLAQSQDVVFSAVVKKLGASDGITVTFVDRTVTGTSRTWTVRAQKPNLLFAESESHTLHADGSRIVVFEKTTNCYTAEDQTAISLSGLLERSELLSARLFLEPEGEWLKSARFAGNRDRKGVALTGTVLTSLNDQIATIYCRTSDCVISYIQIETNVNRKKATRIFDRFTVVPKDHATFSFMFTPTSGANDVSNVVRKRASGNETEAVQSDVARGGIPYRQLKWDDFRSVPNKFGRMVAYTSTYLRTNYEWDFARAGNEFMVRLTKVEVRSGMDTKESWKYQGMRQADLDTLLSHEQGHLDINEIQARKLRRVRLGDWPTAQGTSRDAVVAEMHKKLDKIVDDAVAEGNRQHALYDKETNSGTLHDAQRRWEQKIAERLSAQSEQGSVSR